MFVCLGHVICDKMEDSNFHGSIAEELLKAIRSEPYRGIVSYIGRDRSLTPREYADTELNNVMWLDVRNCKIGRKLNRTHVFELFASYSGENPDDVREGMLVKMRLDYSYYTQVGNIILGKKSLETWMNEMSKPTTPGNELVIFTLSKLYDRHTVIYNSTQPWTTLRNVPSDLWELHTKCHTHLVYVGRNTYGVLRKRPFVDVDAPQSVDEIIAPMLLRPSHEPVQSEPLNLTVLHENTNCDNTVDTPQNVNLIEENQPNLEDVPELGTEVEVNVSEEDTPVTVDEHRSAPFMAAIDDAREKLLTVSLNQLTNAELEKYLCTKVDNSDLRSEHESEPQPSTSTGRQSRLRGTIVNYQESSMEDDSDGRIVSDPESELDNTDSWVPPRRSTRRVSRHGPSSARIAAQCSKGLKDTVAKKSTGRISPALSTNSSSSGSSRTAPSEESLHRNAHSNNEVPDPTLAKNPNRKRKGVLNIKTVGIKKPKRDRRFSCAKCEYSGSSTKLLNEHYMDQHDPVTCEICGKQFNTPTSLKRHKYKHVDGKHVCTDCGEKFAFPSELKNHRVSHIEDRGFCMHGNCGKTFKVENELNKHVKKHSGVVWSCDCCTYTTDDCRNLQKHLIM